MAAEVLEVVGRHLAEEEGEAEEELRGHHSEAAEVAAAVLLVLQQAEAAEVPVVGHLVGCPVQQPEEAGVVPVEVMNWAGPLERELGAETQPCHLGRTGAGEVPSFRTASGRARWPWYHQDGHRRIPRPTRLRRQSPIRHRRCHHACARWLVLGR